MNLPAPPKIRKAKSSWKYILVDQTLVSMFFNFFISWGITWLVFRSVPIVPRLGELSVAADIFATSWIMPLVTCLIVTLQTRYELRRGTVVGLPVRKTSSRLLKVLSDRLIVRALLWIVAGRFLIGPVAVAVVQGMSFEATPLLQFLTAKSFFATGLGLLIFPIHAWWALHDPVSKATGDVHFLNQP